MNGEIGKKDKECDLIVYLLSCLEGKAETWQYHSFGGVCVWLLPIQCLQLFEYIYFVSSFRSDIVIQVSYFVQSFERYVSRFHC